MSAIGTTLGPSLGGLLISGFGWRTIFLVNVPLGLLNLLLARRYLPADRGAPKASAMRFDSLGTLLLALTLAAYALAMTIGRGQFGLRNGGLLAGAAVGIGLFALAETRAASPLIRPAMFRNPLLSASLAMSVIVATVIMSTLVVGPFYLSRSLGLGPVQVGLILSIGPIVSTVSGVLAGRIVDRFGAPFMVMVGLAQMAAGACALALLPALFGVAGYIAAIAVLSPGYQLFQAANGTVVMLDVEPGQRGVISGMLSLSRNLGLITGASVMGAVFAAASGTTDLSNAAPDAIAIGMRITFIVASALLLSALALAIGSRALAARLAAR
jgi:MFS family permease